MPKNLLLKAGSKKKHRKLTGAAARSHAKGKSKSRAKAPHKGGGVMHKAYSYRGKGGKMVHVAAHVEHPKSHR